MKKYLKIFNEFTIIDWANQASPIIKRTRKIRNKIKGQEVHVAKVIDIEFDENSPVILFATEPTFSFNVPVMVGPKTQKMDNLYDIRIQLLDLAKWKDSPWITMPLKEFKEILDVVEIKIDCTCFFFHWGGIRYQLSQLDSAIKPTRISDPVWRKRHGEGNVPTLCKHSLGVVRAMKFNSAKILSEIRKKAKEKDIKF